MTVHMVRVFSAKSVSQSKADSWVSDWLSKHTEWTDDDVSHELYVRQVGMDGEGVEYFQGDFRFDWSDDKIPILDDAENDLGANVEWFRFGYHICYHDEDEPQNCAWDDIREGGTVPSGIPTFTGV